MADVDLILTCFERNYRKVLKPEHVRDVVRQNCYPFKNKLAIINNVDDKQHARLMAEELLVSGEIDAYYFVDEHIENAYRITNLSAEKLEPLRVYSDAFLVAACLPGSEYLMHWDADITLNEAGDWISPSLDLLQSRPDVFATNPLRAWEDFPNGKEFLSDSRFAVGMAFSDQCFLVRRAEIAAPIYDHFSLATMRYPLAKTNFIFEARVDSFMQTHGRIQVTYLHASYTHVSTPKKEQKRTEQALAEFKGSAKRSIRKSESSQQAAFKYKQASNVVAEILLLCARTKIDERSKERIAELLTKEFSWNIFIMSAETHGLAPLAHWHLRAIAKDILSAEKMQSLGDLFMTNVGNSIRLSDELVKILGLLESNQIKSIPFKGSVLAEVCYGDISLRPTSDLDILVQKESVTSAIRILREMGYKPCAWRERHFDESFFESAQFLNSCHEYTFVNKAKKIFVDLHWKIQSEQVLPLTWDEINLHSENRKFKGRQIVALKKEFLLMLLCTHASNHAFYRMNWIVDIAQLLDQMADTDWQSFFALARSKGVERAVLLGIYLTEFLPLPYEYPQLKRVVHADPRVVSIGDEIINRFRNDAMAGQWNELKNWTFKVAMKRTPAEKLGLLGSLIGKPTLDECMFTPLPKHLHSLYSLLRPASLFVQHVPRITARLLTFGYNAKLEPKPE